MYIWLKLFIKRFIFLLWLFIFLPLLGAEDIIDRMEIKTIDHEDIRLVIRNIPTKSAGSPFYGDIQVTTGQNPARITVNAISEDHMTVYSKTATFLPHSQAIFEVKTFKFCPDIDYRIKVIVNDTEYNWTDIYSYPILTREEVKVTYAPRGVKEVFARKEAFYSLDIVSLTYEQWLTLSHMQKQALLDWVKIGGSVYVKGLSDSNDFLNFLEENAGPLLNFFQKIQYRLDGSASSALSTKEKIEPYIPWEQIKFNALLFIPFVIIFALVLGPGLVFFSKKSNKPILLLIFIPGLSLLFSFILVFVSIFQYGITPRVSLRSVAYLDQTKNEVIIHQLAVIESPLGGPRLSFPEDAFVYPINNEEANCVVEEGKMIFSPAAIPARIPVFFYMSRIYKDKRRLEIKESANGFSVVNGLGTDLKFLRLRTEEGLYYYNNPIRTGEQVKIEKANFIDQSELYQIENEFYNNSYTDGIGYLPFDKEFYKYPFPFPGCYEAELKENVFGVDILKDNRELVAAHGYLLLGVYK